MTEYAFPGEYERYNETEDQTEIIHQPGMKLRDYFAARVMVAMLSSDKTVSLLLCHDEVQSHEDATNLVGRSAYRYADAMIKARDD